MDQFALTYLFSRACYRIGVFFKRWFVGSLFTISSFVLVALSRFDQVFALKVNARHLLDPLYQDHSIIGHTLGFFFRFWRLVIGGVLYACIMALGVVVYVGWVFVPLALVYYALTSS